MKQTLKLMLLVLSILLFAVPFASAQFKVKETEYKIFGVDRNEIHEVPVGQPFRIKLKITNIGTQDITTGRVIFICKSVDIMKGSRLCGDLSSGGTGGIIGKKDIKLKSGESVIADSWGMFNEKASPGKWRIYAYVDATGMPSYILVPQIEINVINPKDDWVAVQSTKIEYAPENGESVPNYVPTKIGERYSITHTIKNYNQKHNAKVKLRIDNRTQCDEVGEYIPVEIPAGGEIKRTFHNCKAIEGTNYAKLYPYIEYNGINAIITTNPSYWFFVGSKQVSYLDIHLSSGPLPPNTTQIVDVKIQNTGKDIIQKGSKINLKIEELDKIINKYRSVKIVVDKNFSLDEDLKKGAIKELKLEFNTPDRWIDNYKVTVTMYDVDGSKIKRDWRYNFILYFFTPNLVADVDKDEFNDGVTECKYFENKKEKGYRCTVNKNEWLWIEFNFNRKELLDEKKLIVSTDPLETVVYKFGSIYVYANPFHKTFYFTIPNTGFVGTVSAPDIDWIEGLIILLLGIIIFGIFAIKRQ